MSNVSPLHTVMKRFLIESLDAILFSKTAYWSENDTFLTLPLLHRDDEFQLRGAMWLNQHQYSSALRMLVCLQEDGTSRKVCYRISSVQEIYQLPDRTVYPRRAPLDFSLADVNLGMEQDAALSLACNNGTLTEAKTLTLLQFLTDSQLVELPDEELFGDQIEDKLSYPPYPSDPHFQPIFIARED